MVSIERGEAIPIGAGTAMILIGAAVIAGVLGGTSGGVAIVGITTLVIVYSRRSSL